MTRCHYNITWRRETGHSVQPVHAGLYTPPKSPLTVPHSAVSVSLYPLSHDYLPSLTLITAPNLHQTCTNPQLLWQQVPNLYHSADEGVPSDMHTSFLNDIAFSLEAKGNTLSVPLTETFPSFNLLHQGCFIICYMYQNGTMTSYLNSTTGL